MDSIIFEKQDGMLCAQHALNVLMQQAENLYSAEDLAVIATELDREENDVLGEDAQNRESQNMDDTGFFSLHVIERALKQFDLDLIRFDHPNAAAFMETPTLASAYICNHLKHWFTLRKFGNQWFNLNSLKSGPELLSDTYLTEFVRQLHGGGCHVYLVDGQFPECNAERVISVHPVLPTPRSSVPGVSGSPEDEDIAKAVALSLGEEWKPKQAAPLDANVLQAMKVSQEQDELEDAALQAVLAKSRQEVEQNDIEEQERQFQLALLKSMEDTHQSFMTEDVNESDYDRQMRMAVEASLESVPMDTGSGTAQSSDTDMTREAAGAASSSATEMEPVMTSDDTATTGESAEEVRRNRMAFLDKLTEKK